MKMLRRFALFLVLSNASQLLAEGNYPAEWWKPFPKNQAESWEILPQDAKPGEVILSKRTELGIFSNFSAAPFVFDGEQYPCLEGFWQMMKYPEGPRDERSTFPGITWKFSRQEVSQMLGFDAKRAGDLGSTNMKTMKMNWVTYQGKKMDYRIPEKGEHYQLIVRAMKAKMDQNPDIKRLLLATGDLVLMPDHDQGEAPPAWKYYQIWMEFRDQLRSGALR